ncbi:MAG TPA: transglycosylase domain-containing protein [Candidatus Eisenbacteria bacterium]|nr:transglycosylase domain-containing protein [Candidatus Eisenbacteria bacterium]
MTLRRLLIAVAALLAVIVVFLLVRFAVEVHAFETLQAEGPAWGFPSRIYSADLPLVKGRVLPLPYLQAELHVRGYTRVSGTPRRPGTWATVQGGALIFLRGFLDAPDPRGQGGPERVRLWLDDSMVVAVRRYGGLPGAPPPDTSAPRLEPMLVSMMLGERNVRRSWVPLERVPKAVQNAIIASEDRRFDTHFGIDPKAGARAIVTNVKAGEIREGGSTITQQLARGLFLGNERTYGRKLREAMLAVGLEVLLSKEKILEMYLNSVYWGQASDAGIGGIAEAARWYFDRPVDSLQIHHGALLAAMIRAPNSLDPFTHADLAMEMRNDVLDDMVESKRLEAAEAARLRALPLGVQRGKTAPRRFVSYGGWVREILARRLSKRAAQSWGLSVFTTMDPAWQATAEASLRSGLWQLESGMGRRGLQGAFVALDANTGAVTAMVGGRDPDPGDFNRAYQARRQTGSAIKPIVYATAFMGGGGASFTPASTVSDSPRVFGRGRWAWKPRNFADNYHESVTLAQALALSLNVATTNLVDAIGPSEVARTAEAFGLGRLKAVQSIGLGTNEVTPLALTSAFAVFAAGGMRHAPTPIRAIVDARGEALEWRGEPGADAIPPGIAALMTGLLQNVVRYGVAMPLRGWYGFDRPVGGKTGTTNDFHDAWFVGFTPHIVAGVWIGYDRPASLGRPATQAAIPVWAGIVKRMLAGFPPTPFASDAELEWTDIEPWTGLLADTSCTAMNVPFLRGTSPVMACLDNAPWYGSEFDSLYADSAMLAVPDTFYEQVEADAPQPLEPAEPETTEVPPDTAWTDSFPPP